MNEELFEKQKHNIDHQKSHDGEAQNQRKHNARFIILFDVVSILQRRLVEIM